MNIIPEEPAVYEEFSRPTPGLNNLLTTKQFNYYITANNSQLFGYLKQKYQKKIINDLVSNKTTITKKIPNAFEVRKSLLFLGMGFGILIVTRIVKRLAK